MSLSMCIKIRQADNSLTLLSWFEVSLCIMLKFCTRLSTRQTISIATSRVKSMVQAQGDAATIIAIMEADVGTSRKLVIPYLFN